MSRGSWTRRRRIARASRIRDGNALELDAQHDDSQANESLSCELPLLGIQRRFALRPDDASCTTGRWRTAWMNQRTDTRVTARPTPASCPLHCPPSFRTHIWNSFYTANEPAAARSSLHQLLAQLFRMDCHANCSQIRLPGTGRASNDDAAPFARCDFRAVDEISRTNQRRMVKLRLKVVHVSIYLLH
jgi:hypothetical protein